MVKLTQLISNQSGCYVAIQVAFTYDNLEEDISGRSSLDFVLVFPNHHLSPAYLGEHANQTVI